ncbi:MAG: HD domain-containing protein [Candidatus Woesearchaeota archaeon]
MDQKIRKFHELKKVYRQNRVDSRHESSAEHTWSCLVLVDYFLEKTKLDRLKVFELLLYHDVVEIITGDTPILHIRESKHQDELKAMQIIKEQIPTELKQKFEQLFLEFEAAKTPETKFAKAIDKLDATVHELDYKQDWKGWTDEKVRQYNDHFFADFPEIKKFHDESLEYVEKEGYFK